MPKHAKKQIKAIICTLQQARQEEWTHSKNHLICIGKYGPMVKMTNQMPRSGPVVRGFYLTKPDKPVHRAVNDTQ
jgi:hypothetical protein